MEPVILDCGHVELAGGGCATIGCENEQKNHTAELASMIAVTLILYLVRVHTGRGVLDILWDNLPSLF